MIKLIEIEKLHPHPDNPRKNIGDVTELAESIKQSGVLQNLTVVPCTGYYHGEYTVIIGHRRLAAAKVAGLKELPCAIIEMDEKEQIATMLLENMQRCDLTVYEQAQGMQMMLDLGDTIAEISEKTGFSETTIRRRTKLLKLDEEKFKKSEERQVNILEYDKLFEIEDEETRNELLDHIGTQNFNNKFIQAKADAERKKKKAVIIEAVAPFATEVSSSEQSKYKYVGHIQRVEDIPDDREDVPYYFSHSWGAGIYLYREHTKEEKADIDEKKRQIDEDRQRELRSKERKAELSEISERFFELRFDFVKNFNVKNEKDKVIEFASMALLFRNTYACDIKTIEKLLDARITGSEEFRSPVLPEKFIPIVTRDSLKTLFYTAYSLFHDDGKVGYHDWRGMNCENKSLDALYGLLEILGYEMSDEEKEYQKGNHKLFEV